MPDSTNGTRCHRMKIGAVVCGSASIHVNVTLFAHDVTVQRIGGSLGQAHVVREFFRHQQRKIAAGENPQADASIAARAKCRDVSMRMHGFFSGNDRRGRIGVNGARHFAPQNRRLGEGLRDCGGAEKQQRDQIQDTSGAHGCVGFGFACGLMCFRQKNCGVLRAAAPGC